MTTRVLIKHGGGNHPIVVKDANGQIVAQLEKDGDEFGDYVYDGRTFTAEEGTEVAAEPEVA